MSARPLVDGEILDVRLVPAALTCWLVTAVGILCPLGPILAAGFALMALAVLAARLRIPGSLAGLSAGLLAICTVGALFGLSITLRDNQIRSHPLVSRFGAVLEVTATPTESPRVVGSGRLMFKADLDTVGGDQTRGRVTVFASGVRFAETAAGRPMWFRATHQPAAAARPQCGDAHRHGGTGHGFDVRDTAGCRRDTQWLRRRCTCSASGKPGCDAARTRPR